MWILYLQNYHLHTLKLEFTLAQDLTRKREHLNDVQNQITFETINHPLSSDSNGNVSYDYFEKLTWDIKLLKLKKMPSSFIG